MPHEFHFIRPLWLLALIPLVLLLWRLASSGAGSDAWRGLVDDHLLSRLLSDDGGRVRRLPLVLLGLGWLLGVLALAGPAWQRLPQPVYQAQDYRVIAMDLSTTMNATDMPPSRLAHARFELQDLLRKSREGQTALLAYGAEPFVVAPLTNDTATIAAQVPSLSSDLLPVQGDRRTDLVLERAGELLQQAGAPNGEVILITDGLDHPAAAYDAARKLRSEGYSVSVLGLGTAKGAPVAQAGGGFLKDSAGAIVMPGLQQESLGELATVGAGRFVIAGLGDRDIETLIPEPANRLGQQAQEQQLRSDQWREAGPWLLLLLLPLAAVAFRRGWLGPLVLVLLITPPPPAQAFAWQDLWLRPDQQAVREFEAGRQAEAAKQFQRPDWRAAAEYASGDYEQALQALAGIETPRADYNKGNALARLGRLEDAIATYDKALSADPDDADARHNRELVQQLLERQKQQQNQQNPQQSGQQNEQQQQDQSAEQDQQQQSSGQGQQEQQNASPQPGEQAQDQQQQAGSEGQPQGEQESQSQQNEQQQAGNQGEQGEQQPQQAEAATSQPKEESDQSQEESQMTANKDDAQEQEEAGESAQQAMARSDAAEAKQNQAAAEPERSDLLGGKPAQGAIASSTADSKLNAEDHQAMEQMLRRVEDDPAGLLRQRFLLQHLRRSGQLP
jgi:Ca-activated chloride channel family protein